MFVILLQNNITRVNTFRSFASERGSFNIVIAWGSFQMDGRYDRFELKPNYWHHIFCQAAAVIQKVQIYYFHWQGTQLETLNLKVFYRLDLYGNVSKILA